MADKFILDEHHRAIPCADLMEWARWFEAADRRVARDEVGDVEVSTVFLGLDHSHGRGAPMLFETMTFGGGPRTDEWCSRYSTWDEALAGHGEVVRAVRIAQAG